MSNPSQRLPTKTMLRRERSELRRRIYAEAEQCFLLRGTALGIVDYIYSFTDEVDMLDAPYFERKTDWIMSPDNWVALSFSHTRKHTVHVSVGVPTLRVDPALPISAGRFPSWTRFTVASAQQLPVALRYLEQAYYEAESDYRRRTGRPKRREA